MTRLLKSQILSMATKVFHSRVNGPLWHLHSNYPILTSTKVLNSCVLRCDLRHFHVDLNSQTRTSTLRTPHFTSQTFIPKQHFSTFLSPLFESSPRPSGYFPSGYDGLLHSRVNELPHLNNWKLLRPFSSNKDSTSGKPNETDSKDLPENKMPEDEKKLTLYQRFKKTYKEHGLILVGVHLMTSAVWFGSFYTLARCGVDIVPTLESWNLSERIVSPFRSGGLGDVALAYLLYKLATPARYTVTIGGTNLAIRYLRKEGKMEPLRKEDTLREMYKEGKAGLKRKGINTRRKFKSMETRIRGRIRRGRRRR